MSATLYLLADSQLLFWSEGDTSFMTRVRDGLDAAHPSAAYIGASNGDQPEFYGIFEAAMASAGIDTRRQIVSNYGLDDARFLHHAELIVLAGGDVARGWDVFESTGMGTAIRKRHREGATLIGISAGSVQLGLKARRDANGDALIDTFGMVPHIVDVHDEAGGWARLRSTLAASGLPVRGLGIPPGGGLAYHPDHRVEPLRRPLVELEPEVQRGKIPSPHRRR